MNIPRAIDMNIASFLEIRMFIKNGLVHEHDMNMALGIDMNTI